MNDKTLEKINKFLELSQQDTLTPNEVDKFISMVLEYVAKAKNEFETLSSENIQTIKDSISYIENMHTKHMSEMDVKDTKLTKEIKSAEDTFNTKIKQAQKIIDELQAIELKDGVDGEKGADGTNGIDGKDGSPDTGEEIVTKINELPEESDYKIDWLHIKNVPAFATGKSPNGGGWRNLFQLHDVNIDTPTNGQVLAYNSTTQLWENTTGGGGGSSLSLETDGTPNGSQTLLNLIGGTNITLTDDGLGGVTIDSSGSGSQTLAQTLVNGNTTGTNDIILSPNGITNETQKIISGFHSGDSYLEFFDGGASSSFSLLSLYGDAIVGGRNTRLSSGLGALYLNFDPVSSYALDGLVYEDAATNTVFQIINGVMKFDYLSAKSSFELGGDLLIGYNSIPAMAATYDGKIKFYNSTNGNDITIGAGVTSASYSLLLPTAQGSAGTFLQNDGSGNLSWSAGGSGTVTSVSGTANRILITGTATDPIVDIDPFYVGQSSITTLGTIGTGVWQGSLVTGQYGGTGVNNNGKTITLGGNFATSGAFAATLTLTGVTNVTLPTTGTLATLAGVEALTNKTVNGNTFTTGTYTLTGTAAKTLNFKNSLTLSGTDSTTMTFPTTSATIARTDAGQTFTGVNTFTSPATTTSITTGSTSFTAWAGATTLLTIGGTGASASMFAPSTLDTTSSTTGAIRTSGGISAAKAMNVGTKITVGTTIELGNATDTTLARVAAGIISVEGETINGYTTTATAAGTTTLTIASSKTQYFTGSSTQTCLLPTTSVIVGQTYSINNNSTGLVTVQSSGANTIQILGAGMSAQFTAIVATPTTAANWSVVLKEFTGLNKATTATANAATIDLAYKTNSITNNSAATLTITLPTAGAIDGESRIVRVYDFSAATQTISWTNTENSLSTAPTTSNGSTTLPATVGFMYNSATSKWRCIAVS